MAPTNGTTQTRISCSAFWLLLYTRERMRQADAMKFKMAKVERRVRVMVALINFHLPDINK